jgi:AmiR/NasT family two-component response regulator
MAWDDKNVDQDLFFVDTETGEETHMAEIIAFPRGAAPQVLAFTDENLLRTAEEAITRAVKMSGDFSELYPRIHAAIDEGDMQTLEDLRDQLRALRERHGFSPLGIYG